VARILSIVRLGSLLPFWLSWAHPIDGRELQDPMQPPSTTRTAKDLPLGTATPNPLWAVRSQAGHPQALVHGRWVNVGESALGGMVTSIDESGIHLKRNGVIEHLKLLPEIAATTRRSPVPVSP
jgi:hypothetical protein